MDAACTRAHGAVGCVAVRSVLVVVFGAAVQAAWSTQRAGPHCAGWRQAADSGAGAMDAACTHAHGAVGCVAIRAVLVVVFGAALQAEYADKTMTCAAPGCSRACSGKALAKMRRRMPLCK